MANLNRYLLKEVRKIQEIDSVGHEWCAKNYVGGYTSYGSMDNLHKMSPNFGELSALIDKHVRAYIKSLELDLGGAKFWMNSCWVNVMPALAHHSFHIHPLSFISGTYYLKVPKGASCIKFEDPRLSYFMGTPPRKLRCREENKPFFSVQPKEGQVVLFESWLRHEVPAHTSKQDRISVSFNYSWDF